MKYFNGFDVVVSDDVIHLQTIEDDVEDGPILCDVVLLAGDGTGLCDRMAREVLEDVRAESAKIDINPAQRSFSLHSSPNYLFSVYVPLKQGTCFVLLARII